MQKIPTIKLGFFCSDITKDKIWYSLLDKE